MKTGENSGLFATAVLAVAVFMALLAAACGAGGPAASSSGTPSSLPPLVRVATVTQGGAPASFSYTGDVRPQAQVSIAAKMPGRLQEVKVDVGDSVKKGDLLAVLEHSALDAQVKQAEAAVALARAKLA
ncbi:MAG: biotin/lipoyl-binding protein, partial [Chloroflexota bacterium]|nr:biotin/lipoyl-binding protein [Chloroflexota bacterium]